MYVSFIVYLFVKFVNRHFFASHSGIQLLCHRFCGIRFQGEKAKDLNGKAEAGRNARRLAPCRVPCINDARSAG